MCQVLVEVIWACPAKVAGELPDFHLHILSSNGRSIQSGAGQNVPRACT